MFTVHERRALRYDAPWGDVHHVRAASAVRAVQGRLWIVQDDALCVAIVEGARVAAVPLPTGPDGARVFSEKQGNKKHKPDLEAAVVGDGALFAFGSGSTPARERVAAVPFDRDGRPSGSPRWLDGSALYAALRAEPRFSGSELNIEGALLADDGLWLVQRGNGAPASGLGPIDAVARVELGWWRAFSRGEAVSPPTLHDVRSVSLGALDGVRLTYTDVAEGPGGRWFLASAEDSPDTYQDGRVVGSALIAPGGDVHRLSTPNGSPLADKAEGLCFVGEEGFVVVDADDPDRPADLLTLRRAASV